MPQYSTSTPQSVYRGTVQPSAADYNFFIDSATNEAFFSDGTNWTEIPTSGSFANVAICENSLAILEIQAADTITPDTSATMVRDIFSDSGGYLNTIDTGAATTATFNTNKYGTAQSVGSGIVATMTADNAPSPLVASASAYTGAFNPFCAFDAGGSTWYRSATHTGWLKIDLGVGNATIANRISMEVFDANSAPKDYTIQGSNNDSDWTTLSTITGQADNFNGNVDFTNSTAYRYYKIDITDAYGADLGIKQLQYYTRTYNASIVQTNMQTLSSTPSKFQVFAYRDSGTLTVDISFDNGAHYQTGIALNTETDITNTGSQMILKINFPASAAECQGVGVLYW